MAKDNSTADRVQAAMNFIGGDEVLDMLIAGLAKVKIVHEPHLGRLTPVTLPKSARNLYRFFSNREGLEEAGVHKALEEVSKENLGFRRFHAEHPRLRQPSKLYPDPVNEHVFMSETSTIAYADTVEWTSDALILAELPRGAVYEDMLLCLSHIATLIDQQWDGREGQLLTGGSLNQFYSIDSRGEFSVVCVEWNDISKIDSELRFMREDKGFTRSYWHVSVSGFNQDGWTEVRVFSATAVDKELTW